MQKRFLAIVLAMLMCLALFACDTSSKKKDRDDDDSSSDVTSSVSEDSSLDDSSDDASDESSDVSSDTSTDTSTDTSADDESSSDDKDNGDSEGSSPLLYKVTDDNGNVIWLMGSIHVGREDYYPLPDYVMDAFEGSDVLAVEADIVAFENDSSAFESILMSMLYLDGSSIASHISAEIYEEAVEILTENNMYMSALEYYKPYMWYSFIDEFAMAKIENVDATLGIDRYFINLAYEDNMSIDEIESVEIQFNMFNSFSDEIMEVLLQDAIYSYYNTEETQNGYDELMNIWASGDEDAFAEYLNQDSEFEDDALYKEYNDAMIVTRNENMADYAEDALASGEEVFICVGAAHVVGEGAMADLLGERGYTVELVR